MTERSAEQAPAHTRPDTADTTQDTARIPLTERLQRRISAAADERRHASSHSASAPAPSTPSPPRDTGRVLPPPPPELAQQTTPAERTASPNGRPASETQPVSAQPQPWESGQPVTPARAATVTTRRTRAQVRARRARLRLSRIDPWSVMKVSFLLSIAFGIVTVVSVFMVWSVLGAAGVWSSINNTVSDTVSSGNNVSSFNIEDYLGMSRVLGFTMLVSVIDVVLITAIATLGAFLYNMAASLLGGIEVTLAEDA
jgi:hypothetical protein